MNRHTSTLVMAAGLVLALLFTLVVLGPVLLSSQDCTSISASNTAAVGGASAGVTGPLPASVGRWSGVQLANAAAVISAGKALGVSTHGQVVGVMTAMGESSLTVVDHGDAVGPDSRGLFQQRANGAWGTYADRMNPTTAAANFFRALVRVPGWEQMTPTLAAHQTQRNADPNYYTQFLADAVRVVAALTGQVDATTSLSPTNTGACPGAVLVGGGKIAFPLPAGSGYRDLHNWHAGGSHWGAWHTGDDFSTPCGTPVAAVNAGEVVIRTDQAWAGRWLVEVSSGAHALTTWYAHMRAVTVTNGQYVTAGQPIGEVGDLGNATGCHLHLEVHLTNGTIYGPDNVDPSTWLTHNLGHTIGISPAANTTATGTGTTSTGAGAGVGAGMSGSQADGGFRLVSFNILGDSHTGHPGADQHPTWPNGAARMPGALAYLNAWGTDVAGLQEVQPSQRYAFDQVSGGGYRQYPRAGAGGDNRIIWRTSTFSYVRDATFSIPYFNGHPTPMPAVLLRQNATGKLAWFLNVHNPAETGTYHHQGGYRAQAVAIERAAVRQLLTTGVAVFLTGDLNDRGTAFCPLAADNLLRAAAGGSNTGGVCRVPADPQIDWIFAAGNAGFTGYLTDNRPPQHDISDHPIVVSVAHIG